MRKVFFLVLALALACATAAQAGYVNVVEARVAGGAQNSLFTMSGPAASTGKSTAAPLAGWTGGVLTGTGNYYAGDTTPVKWGDWAFTPAADKGGYYNVYATWVNVTAAQNMPPIWTVNNAGTAVTASPSQATGGNAWNLLATGKKFNASTTYTTRLATPGTNTAGKRASFDSVAWAANTPTAATLSAPPNGAIGVGTLVGGLVTVNLGWTGGTYNSFFDVFFDLNPSPTTKIGSNLAEGTTSLSVGSLLPLTTYYWKVTSKNVDLSANTAIRSFTTVPEPSSLIALGAGFVGLVGMIRRRKT